MQTAIVGLGWVAQARHIPAIRRAGHHIVGVVDRRPGRAKAVAEKYGLARWTEGETLNAAPWIGEADAVSIATPPFAHHELALEAASRRIAVITEKPFAMSPAEGEEMAATAASRDQILCVVHNFQFARSMQRLRKDLNNGRIGRLRGIRALQFGNPSRRLPEWFETLPLGLFYDESPHLLYLLRNIAGPLKLIKAVTVEARENRATPYQIDAWFKSDAADYPITLSCNFESSVSEWYVLVHGEQSLGVVDIFRDIYLRLPNDRAHATLDVLRTSVAATVQHWAQHVTSGVPHLTGRLLYGNEEIFTRFGEAAGGDRTRIEPIDATAALDTLKLQHDIINQRERIFA